MTSAKFPDVFIESADTSRPSQIADYAIALAYKFNTFYSPLPVVKAKPPKLSEARLALVRSTKTVLRNALGLLGIIRS